MIPHCHLNLFFFDSWLDWEVGLPDSPRTGYDVRGVPRGMHVVEPSPPPLSSVTKMLTVVTPILGSSGG